MNMEKACGVQRDNRWLHTIVGHDLDSEYIDYSMPENSSVSDGDQ